MRMLQILLCSMQSLVILFMHRIEEIFGLAAECVSIVLMCIVVTIFAMIITLGCAVAKVNDKLRNDRQGLKSCLFCNIR